MIGPEDNIGLLGAVDGRVDELVDALEWFSTKDVSVVVQLGDLGLLSDVRASSALDRVDRVLDERNMVLLFVDGERDDQEALSATPEPDTGIRWVSSLVGNLPRGSRGPLQGEQAFAAMGGSGDPSLTAETADSWTELTAPSSADLERLGWGAADVLLSHDAPLDVLAVDRHLAAQPAPPAVAEVTMRLGRSMLDQAVSQTMPRLVFTAHYRLFFDETVGRLDASGFGYPTRVIGLAPCSSPGISRAILRAATLAVDFYNHSGSPIVVPKRVTNLLEVNGGRWLIDTQGSSHEIDLDRMTIERRPGPRSGPTINDGVHRIRSFERCRIGRSGYWTLHADDYLTDFQWHRTSVIRHIERLED